MYGKFVKCVPQNIWRSQDIFRCSSLPSILLSLTSGSFVVDKRVYHAAGLQACGESCLHFHLLGGMIGLQMCAPTSTFYMGSGDPNYILQTIMASTLSTEPSPQHHTGFSYLRVVIQIPLLESSFDSSYYYLTRP